MNRLLALVVGLIMSTAAMAESSGGNTMAMKHGTDNTTAQGMDERRSVKAMTSKYTRYYPPSKQLQADTEIAAFETEAMKKPKFNTKHRQRYN